MFCNLLFFGSPNCYATKKLVNRTRPRQNSLVGLVNGLAGNPILQMLFNYCSTVLLSDIQNCSSSTATTL